ncbi:MAG: glutamine--tRNA ligase/YqeY domain fusion protein [Gammaproteobacteria bacterium]|nr:glutamine--tRNA ligase/YqeY domain fusion protein [Gammaproteobacteria bacterium]
MTETVANNFIRRIIDTDLENNKNQGKVATRFPPEPNGYLHIGHAKSICLNFALAKDYNGTCNLRFDDTNPEKEDMEYIESIINTVRWLGFDWEDRLYYASDYFETMYELALKLIKSGKAYVCDLTPEEIREYRGTLTAPGKNSPYRNRSIEENLDLFSRMRAGEFADGSKSLRAKIDMASPNMNMRDPIIYRIRTATHPRTGDKWCIYPMYDYAHGLSDSLENITHSICTLEFEDHRPLYDWFLDELQMPCHSQQIEFARLNLNYTIMSKRVLLALVQKNLVSSWSDPRLPTLEGMRRRGVPPEAIRNFCDMIGVSKQNSVIDLGVLEECIRDYLNQHAKRVLAVLKPLKIVIENFPEDKTEELDAALHPQDPTFGSRKIPFTRELYIEQDDFMEEPTKGFFRLTIGKEVRLRYAYFIKCHEIIKNPATGEIIELRCTYDPETRGGKAPDGRKVKGTIHWVSAPKSLAAEVRLYDRLFTEPNPAIKKDADYAAIINPDSLITLTNCRVEPGLANAKIDDRLQFERLGYFCLDFDANEQKLVFNRTVSLRDTWGKIKIS